VTAAVAHCIAHSVAGSRSCECRPPAGETIRRIAFCWLDDRIRCFAARSHVHPTMAAARGFTFPLLHPRHGATKSNFTV